MILAFGSTLLTVFSVLSPLSHHLFLATMATWQSAIWLESTENALSSDASGQMDVALLIPTESGTYVYITAIASEIREYDTVSLDQIVDGVRLEICKRSQTDCFEDMTRRTFATLDFNLVFKAFLAEEDATKSVNRWIGILNSAASLYAEDLRQCTYAEDNQAKCNPDKNKWNKVVFEEMMSTTYERYLYTGIFGFKSIKGIFDFVSSSLQPGVVFVNFGH